MTCTFFGHRFISMNIEPQLKAAIIDLIENHEVDNFYVGHQGSFDEAAFDVLSELSESYDITFSVVLSRMPTDNDPYLASIYPHSLFPEGLEKAMEDSLSLQPAIEKVEVEIRFDKLEESMTEFDYTSLTGDMLDVKIHTKVDDALAIIRIEFIEELNYPLMYVEDIEG